MAEAVGASSGARSAVTYSRGTIEYKLLNKPLDEPSLRARRANAHRPSPGEWLRITTGKNWFIQLERENEQQFQYSKLGEDEIRILRLYQSKHPDEPLRADLFKRKLDDVAGGYEALSYCWGTQKATYNIHIRDLNATTPGRRNMAVTATPESMWQTAVNAISHTDFKIRRNLHDALLRLRSKYRDVYLWVDAICIDQSEKGKVEKAKQLAMMARIYNLASNVCVWLGEGYDGAESAFCLVRDIMNYRNFDEMILDPGAQEAWRNLISIMKAPWFGRRWVIQEIALSRDASIHCGDRSLHWDDFADAVSLLMEKIELIRDTFKDDVFDDVETTSACILVQTLINVCRKADQGEDQGRLVSTLLDVETLVSTLLGFQATFPRDTIYSILSLAKDYPRAEEDWQDLHKQQLEVVQNKKLEYVDEKLKATRENKETLEKAQEKQQHLKVMVDQAQRLIEQKKKEKQDARISRDREKESRIDRDLRNMKVQEVEYAGGALQTLDDDILQLKVAIKRLEVLRDRISQELKTQPIGLLPNYSFSPRDLFIAFVTRSIRQSCSLDIICRHWAPTLADDEGGDILPSWISNLSKSPFGVSGTAKGRQNGENFVAYLPHDQRKQYSASDTYEAQISMALDPALDFQDFRSLLEVNVPEFLVPETKLSIAGRQLGLEDLPKTEPDTSSPTHPSPDARNSPSKADAEYSKANSGADLPPNSEDPHSPSDATRRRSSNTGGGIGDQAFGGVSRRPSVSQRTIPAVPQRKERAPKGNSPNDGSVNGTKSPQRKSGQTKQSTRKAQEMRSSQEARQQHRLSGILRVEGFILGEVVDQSEVMRGGIVPGEWVAKLGWKKDVHSENRVPDTLWRLLVADRTEKGGKPPQWYKRACLHGLVDDRVSDNQGNIHPVAHTNRRISELTSRYFKRVESVVWNRRVFELRLDDQLQDDLAPERTQHEEAKVRNIKRKCNHSPREHSAKVNGQGKSHPEEDRVDGERSDGEGSDAENVRKRTTDKDKQATPDPIFGLAPQGCKVSDVVCILFGCSVPVILSRENEGRYRVVGEAYVHGMMGGEATEMADFEGVEFTTFELI